MLLKAVSVLAAFGLFAFLAQGVFGRVSVEVDGKRDLVGVGDTVAEIVAEHPHSARPGDLLSAADRHVVVLGGGGAVRVRLNGEAASPEVRVKPGDRLETLSGADSVEPTVEETRSIPAPTRYEGRGSIVAVAATGSAGVERLVVVPSPSWPKLLLPQQTTPVAVTAQVWLLPAEIAATPLPSPLTGVGVERSVVVPSPSWPPEFSPQQTAAPAVVTAHV